MKREFRKMAGEYLVPGMKTIAVENVVGKTVEVHSRYHFELFEHPYVCEAIRLLNHDGVDELLRWPTSSADPNATKPDGLRKEFFDSDYDPNPSYVAKDWPAEDLDLGPEGQTPYSQYNWELFFHAPLYLADRLSRNQQFAEAQRWLHFLFDPTDRSKYGSPQRFWKMRRFYVDTEEESKTSGPPTLVQLLKQSQDLQKQVTEWMDHPFQPHAIARLRTIAYRKTVIIKYLDNLIAWGDRLFRQDTLEKLNEATQLYILAAQILGKRPERIPPVPRASDRMTFNELKKQHDNDPQHKFDLLHDIEVLVPQQGNSQISDVSAMELVTSLATRTMFFCIPANEKLLGYWDVMEDRLFKIRHCMNIEGITRQLPLFEPPIDPGLLVRAAAAGVDLSSALSEVDTAVPGYRFVAVLQKANEVCAEVKALGGALLSALEKRDGEALSRLRASNEVELLKEVRDIKAKQVEESLRAHEALLESQKLTQLRLDYYSTLIKNGQNEHEKKQEESLAAAMPLIATQAALEFLGAILYLIPDSKLGSPFSIGATFGGGNVGGAIRSAGSGLGLTASALNSQGTMSGILANYARRTEEWTQQESVAKQELEQIKKQTLAAEIRKSLAERELANHEKQTEQSLAVSEFMRDKFTNDQLYDWMVGQLSALYFQTYQMAYDLAKRAERAYQREIGNDAASFIKFGHWDSLKKGLLAGERLQFDLRRLEVAHLEDNKRELEITRHFSLGLIDPEALVSLRETGQCFINLPELQFDLDFPGHYMRRIRNVSLTIPCVAGPYGRVNCTLTLLWHKTRLNASVAQPKFKTTTGAIQSVVTSSGQNDSGLFEANLRDERYLPFEGTGAISQWRIELPTDTNNFDRDTLTDVVIHMRYTARDGGEILRNQIRSAHSLPAFTALAPGVPPTEAVIQARLFSIASDFADAWYVFMHRAASPQLIELDLSDRIPPAARGKKAFIKRVVLLLKLAAGSGYVSGQPPAISDPLEVRVGNATGYIDKLIYGLTPSVDLAVNVAADQPLEVTMMTIPPILGENGGTTRLDPKLVEDMALLIGYSYQ